MTTSPTLPVTTPRDPGAHELVHRRLVAVAERQPGAVAVSGSGTGEGLDYRTLVARASRLAHELRSRGARPERAIVVMLDKGPDVVVAAVATWLAGAAYLPIDPHTPPAAVERVLDRLGHPPLVVSEAAYAPAGPGDAVLLDRDRAELLERPDTPPTVTVHPDNLAYFAHTSGSTGRPKLIGVSHRSLVASYRGWVGPLGLGTQIRSHLQLAGLSFDVHVADLVRALLSGGRLVLCPASTALDPPMLHAVLHDERVDAVLMTPSVMRLFVDWLERTGSAVRRLRQLALGGEPFTVGEAERLRDHLAPGTRILNFYGVAECCVDSAFAVVEPAAHDADLTAPVPLGQAFPGTELVVAGGSGEVGVVGPGLARGYQGSPALTADRFVPAPGGPPGARMYRTGDLADVGQRHLTFAGRDDDQVKVRGVRVEPAAVEAVVKQVAGVSAVVVVTALRGDEAVLVAHVVPSAGAGDTVARRVREHAARHLPTGQSPAAVVVHESLPLGATGKIDRNRLRVGGLWGAAGTGTADTRRPDDAERADAVARSWARVLGRPPDDGTQDFFAAGGTSLTAARLALDLGERLGRPVPVGTVFAAPTLGTLTAALSRPSASRPPSPHVAPGSEAGGWRPAGDAERRIWLLSELRPGDPTYHVPVRVALSGPVDEVALQHALDDLVAENPSLRAVFAPGPDGPVTTVRPGVVLRLVKADGSGDQDDGYPVRWVEELTTRPFDLRRGPLVRAGLVRTGPDRSELVLVAHHLVVDGWSLRLLLDRLGVLYSGRVAEDRSVGRPDVPFAAEAPDPARVAAALDYWLRELSDPPPPLLPGGFEVDRPGRPARTDVELDEDASGRLRSLARDVRTTPFAVLLGGLAALLHRWTGQSDIVVGAPFGDRDGRGGAAVGLQVTTQALRVAAEPAMPFREVVRRARRSVIGAVRAREAPFTEVVHRLGRSGRGDRPLFRVWLNYLGAPPAPPAMAGLDAVVSEPPLPGALFDLCLYVTETGSRFRVGLVCDATVDGRLARAFADQFATLIAQACAAPDRPIADYDLSGAADRAARADPARDLRASGPSDPLYDHVAAVAARAPDRAAVSGPEGPITYRGLGARVGVIDRGLSARGVARGAVVAFIGSRDVHLVATVLAVIGRGATLSMISADQPPSRIAELLGSLDARAVVVPDAETGRRIAPVTGDGRAVLIAGGGGASEATWPAPAPAADPAYLLFTSGTSGTPAAVGAEQEPLSRFLDWYTQRFEIGPGDRVALLSSVGHDPLLRDIFAPLWVGATICPPPVDPARDPDRLYAWLGDHRVTVAHVTPQLCRLLDAEARRSVDSLRLLVVGGDPLTTTDVRAAARWAPHAVVVNAYGTTETPQIASYRVAPEPSATSGPLSVGAGTPHAQLLLLTATGAPAAIGELGRVVVRTPYLAAGYRGAAGRADGFGSDPCSGHRRFSTGDLGRYRVDGEIEIVGRADDQVQVRGFRIDPAEVDRWVRTVPGVLDCSTLDIPGPDGDRRLRCYLVTDPAAVREPDLGAVRAVLRDRLPEYCRPSDFAVVPRLPLDRHGKPDRAALATIAPYRPAAAEHRTAATPTAAGPGPGLTPRVEADLVRIWCEALGLDQVDPNTNVFDLGASSMLLLRVQRSIESETGRRIPIVRLFEYPTIHGLAVYLADGTWSGPDRAGRPDSVADLRSRRLAARGTPAAGRSTAPDHQDSSRCSIGRGAPAAAQGDAP